MAIKVVLADDHPIFREGLVRSLEETGQFEVVGAGASATEAVALVEKHQPDLVVLDVSMPGGGVSAVKQIAGMDAPPKISMLTVSEDDSDVTSALQAGALGYVLKGVSAEELRVALTGVAMGNAHISPGSGWPGSDPADAEENRAGPRSRSTILPNAKRISCGRLREGAQQQGSGKRPEAAGKNRKTLHDVHHGKTACPQPGRSRADCHR